MENKDVKTLFIGPFSPPYTGDGVKNSYLKEGLEAVELSNTIFFDTICRKGNKWLHLLRLFPLMTGADQIILSLNKQGRLVIIWMFFLMSFLSKKRAALYIVGGTFDLQLKWMNTFRRRMYIYAINSLDGVFAESNSLKEGLELLGVRKVEIVYNPRNDDGSKWSLSEQNRNKIAFVSRVTEAKGVTFLMDAVEKVIEEGSNVFLDVYGPIDTDYERFFMERVNNSAGRINYRGLLNPSEVQKSLTKYHCIALPTFHFGEGLPGILVEAGMAGTPIIISRFNALPEYFTDEESALFVEKQDVVSLKESISRLFKDDSLAFKLSAGIQRVVEPFHVDSVIKQSLELFKSYGWTIKTNQDED